LRDYLLLSSGAAYKRKRGIFIIFNIHESINM